MLCYNLGFVNLSCNVIIAIINFGDDVLNIKVRLRLWVNRSKDAKEVQAGTTKEYIGHLRMSIPNS